MLNIGGERQLARHVVEVLELDLQASLQQKINVPNRIGIAVL